LVTGNLLLFEDFRVDIKVDCFVIFHLFEAEMVAELLHLLVVKTFVEEICGFQHNISKVLLVKKNCEILSNSF
jgi:hypothetical protein